MNDMSRFEHRSTVDLAGTGSWAIVMREEGEWRVVLIWVRRRVMGVEMRESREERREERVGMVELREEREERIVEGMVVLLREAREGTGICGAWMLTLRVGIGISFRPLTRL